MIPNIGIIDANLRCFVAVPSIVVAATSALAYHAYPVAVGAIVVGAYFFASGIVRISPMYAALRLSSVGGIHRVRSTGSDIRKRPQTQG